VPADAPAASDQVITVGGFSESEAVRHDPQADVYLVANINGDPTGEDDNGFISRVCVPFIPVNARDLEIRSPVFTRFKLPDVVRQVKICHISLLHQFADGF